MYPSQYIKDRITLGSTAIKNVKPGSNHEERAVIQIQKQCAK